MKIMISQPMHGKNFFQIKDERERLVKKLLMEGNSVIETVFENRDDTKSDIYYLAKSIELLDKCDRIIFMKGWEKARGCIIEYLVAKYYGKEILILKEE